MLFELDPIVARDRPGLFGVRLKGFDIGFEPRHQPVEFDAVGLAAFLIVELVEPFLADAFGGLRLRENLASEPRNAPRKCAVREQEVRRRPGEVIVDEEGGEDRKGAVWGRSVAGRVEQRGRRSIKKKKKNKC